MKRAPFLLPVLLWGCLFTTDEVEPRKAALRVADSPDAFFELFRQAYETRSVSSLNRLLAEDYQFVGDPGQIDDGSPSGWGKEVEMDRHRRMFQEVSDVSMEVVRDGHMRPEAAEAETTWTLPRLRMTMTHKGAPYDVLGQADFRLRTVRDEAGNPTYILVRWIDRN
ncbi:MAG: hypothetical protein IPK50_03235 [Fibrobacterota bacterium]|nr:hypothetical protein [Fibrobacterota bacterium]QQS05910.1 MAG: hypothetical protein IPK50_03235 [Fibrobacterota bacterium]